MNKLWNMIYQLQQGLVLDATSVGIDSRELHSECTTGTQSSMKLFRVWWRDSLFNYILYNGVHIH